MKIIKYGTGPIIIPSKKKLFKTENIFRCNDCGEVRANFLDHFEATKHHISFSKVITHCYVRWCKEKVVGNKLRTIEKDTDKGLLYHCEKHRKVCEKWDS